MVNIAVLGYGTVGSGVVEVLFKNRESLQRKAGQALQVKYILVRRDFPGDPHTDLMVRDFNQILEDPQVQVVAEVMGGLEPAYTYTRACLERGKSVVTSNKELVAMKGAELLALAQQKNLNYLFEASVGGGIPIIRPLSQCLAANDVIEIAGILNGTTNFILTKMIREQMSFEAALALAQQLGYAERNPAADVEGHDSCRKICILASLAYGKHVYPDQVHTEGITKLTLEDVEYAESWGGVIKLIGRVKRDEKKKLQIIVCPMFIPRESQLANVDDVFNGILVRGDSTGDVVFYGKGAGKLPTASAVVADVIDCVKHIGARKYLFWSDGSSDYVEDYMLDTVSMYVRVHTDNVDLAYHNASRVLGGITRLSRKDAPAGELAFITESMLEKDIHKKLGALKELGVEAVSMIRIGDV